MTAATERPTRPRQMYIGGQWCDAADGSTMVSLDPATEEPIGTVPIAAQADVDRAVAAAAAAAPEWGDRPWPERAAALRALAERIDAAAEELAALDTADAGLPINGSRGDVRSAADEIRYFAGLGGEAKGATLPSTPAQLAMSQREPYGVVGRIVPFNHPFKFAAGKCAAPLMAGNAVVLKPAEHTSLSALRFAELAAGLLPPGVLNVVTGPGRVGAALVEHPRVERIAFTGSVPTGRAVLRGAADHIKHVTLELGGKNPMIVFPDADPRRAAAGAVAGMNLRRSMGQSCQSNSRILVHRSIRETFLAELVEQVNALTVGNPHDEATDLGPLAFREHYERVLRYVALGVEQGARLVAGGRRPLGLDRGHYLQPTVFADVTQDMTIATDEIFGPVMAVLDWQDEDEMVELANAVDYGLTANIWTDDLHRAHRTARRLQAGTVWVNGTGRKPLGTPFGGYKHSGLGTESSLDELLSYTRLKSVVVNLRQ
ncbi:NAD/NADP-dependent betaine aldehyde dehydrogenase [Actinomadura sp. NBRC 104412]|uniref:aldehyde dehydrogenase family protein n=1 Tax=Actinomadura sp. NBRC 104412 TaxID=3032203 RepID=UPI00249FC5B5|nr:aldehyde dehydrogenase family protein [Actinomadura sp. NBRC 104412]GLZ07806.1 NAD/NADP-dependent betaine aldehyde dehydrogenase [Actinomadura sp. NBRC 104412]